MFSGEIFTEYRLSSVDIDHHYSVIFVIHFNFDTYRLMFVIAVGHYNKTSICQVRELYCVFLCTAWKYLNTYKWVTLDNASDYRTNRLYWTHNPNPNPSPFVCYGR